MRINKDHNTKDLAIGTIWVAHGYSNDMFRAREDARDAGRPFSVSFFTSKEGAVTIWSCIKAATKRYGRIDSSISYWSGKTLPACQI